jgi:hypothetical protein
MRWVSHLWKVGARRERPLGITLLALWNVAVGIWLLWLGLIASYFFLWGMTSEQRAGIGGPISIPGAELRFTGAPLEFLGDYSLMRSRFVLSTVVFLLSGGLCALAASGLWRLRPWARRLTLLLFTMNVMLLGLLLWNPGLYPKVYDIDLYLLGYSAEHPMLIEDNLFAWSRMASLLAHGAAIWYLLRRGVRATFWGTSGVQLNS